MKKLFVGFNKEEKPLRLDEDIRSRHMHVIGSTGTGKSKFLEWMIRGDIKNGNGLCLIDPHGDLYETIVRWCAYNNFLSYRDITLLNPSGGDFVTGFNPFSKSAGYGDVSTQVNRRIDVTLKAWGVENSDQTPTLERWLRCIYFTLIEKDLSLVEAQYLISFQKMEVLRFLTSDLSEPLIVEEWQSIEDFKNSTEFRNEFQSTKNRLFRLLTNRLLMRFMGLRDHNVDLADIMDSGKILLVNLKESDQLDEKTARLFGTLLVNQLFEVAKRRDRDDPDNSPRPFYLYLDEFQKFATPDIEYILAQGRKMGLHLVLAHQNISQVAKEMDVETLLTNTRTKVVFGGLNRKDAIAMVEEMFVHQLDLQEMKDAVTQTKFWPVYGRDKVTSKGSSSTKMDSHSSGRGAVSGSTSGFAQTMPDGAFLEPGVRTDSHSSGFSSSSMEGYSESWADTEVEAEADIPFYRQVPFKEPTKEYSLEEQKWRLADSLKEQWTRCCFIKILDQKTQPMLVPLVEAPAILKTSLKKYEQALKDRSPCSLPTEDARRQIELRQQRLLESVKQSRKETPYPEAQGFIEE